MDFNDNKPIYLQISDLFCEQILLKKWKESERLPSVRDIAVQMEVNPNTAIRAFDELQLLDIIFNKRGLGYFVSENGYNKALEYKKDEFLKKEVPIFIKIENR